MRVHFQVVEGTRRRTQVFEGIVIKRQGSGARETFTVRKQSFGVGVERTFPLHSPKIEKLEVAARGDVRRAKLYYLRDKVGKSARVAERRWGIEDELVVAAEDAEAVDAEGVAVSEAEAELVEPPEEEGEARRGRGRGAAAGGGGAGRSQDSVRERSGGRARGRWGSGGGGAGAGARSEGRRLPRRGRRLKVPRPHSTQGALLELVIIVALALGLALGIQAFIVKPYQIPSESMEPTLDVGQRVLVNRFLYHFKRSPDRGHRRLPPARRAPTAAERAAMRRPEDRRGRQQWRGLRRADPQEASVNFIKRIVAGPGDTLSVQNGHPVVNGKIAQESLHQPLHARRSLQFAAKRSPSRPIITS